MNDLSYWLEKHGWIKYGDNKGYYWAKRWPKARKCNLNFNQDGIQTTLRSFDLRPHGGTTTIYTIKLHGEKADGVPVELQSYNILEKNLKGCLEEQAQDLVDAWNLMERTANQRYYDFKEKKKPKSLRSSWVQDKRN